MIGLSKNQSFKTRQLLLSTEIFSKRRKIYPRCEGKPEYDQNDTKLAYMRPHFLVITRHWFSKLGFLRKMTTAY